MHRRLSLTGSLAAVLALLMALSGCATSGPTDAETSPVPASSPSIAAAPTASRPSATSAQPEVAAEKTIVRFTSPETTVEVTINQGNPTARDFLSLLPLTLPVKEFAGKEKIAALPRDLVTEGSLGSDPEDGDLIYFIPWGNIGFYYNTDGIGYSDQTIHLGTYNATAEQLAQLEDGPVTVEIVPSTD
ncbi:cyclophilin-like fold protein [Arthrobacter sp. Sr24]